MSKQKDLYFFLRNNPTNIREVKSLQQDRIKSIINRIWAFSSPRMHQEIKNTEFTDSFFRYIALEAAINFVSNYPMLKHTPASLRNLFSVPTRQDRKKGRYSTQNLRDRADILQRKPNWKTLSSLTQKLSGVNLKSQSLQTYLDQLINYIENDIQQRNLPLPPVIYERNDHTEFSINRLKNLFSSHLPQITSLSEALPSIDGEPTPDLIIELEKSKTWWFELKEWDNFELILKPAYQVIRYLIEAGNVIFWLNGDPITFFDDMPELFSVDQVISHAKKQMASLKNRETLLRKKSNSFWTIGRILYPHLTLREKAIFLTIIDEIAAEDLGLLYAEKKAGKNLLKLLTENSTSIGKIHKSTFSFEKLINSKIPTILIQKNYQWD